MKKIFLIALGVVLGIVVVVISYGAYLNQAGESNIKSRTADKKLTLHGARAKVQDIKMRLALDTVHLYSNEMTDAVALVDGRISAVEVHKNDHVKQGQILFRLVNEQLPGKIRQAEIEILKAESDIAKAEAGLAKAENDYGRYERLRARDAVTPQKFEEVAAGYKEAQVLQEQAIAQRDILTAQLEQLLIDSDHTQVQAPIEGDVLLIYKQLGSYVNAGTPLALVGNFHRLYFSLPLEDVLAKGVAVGQNASLDFSRSDFAKVYDTKYVAGNAGARQSLTARILSISPDLQETAAMRTVLFEVDNRAGLLEPQNYNNLVVRSNISHRGLTVPLSALDLSRTEAFVLGTDGALERRTVAAGIDDGEYVEILSGIAEGEIVIISDVEGLENGMKAEVKLEEGRGN